MWSNSVTINSLYVIVLYNYESIATGVHFVKLFVFKDCLNWDESAIKSV